MFNIFKKAKSITDVIRLIKISNFCRNFLIFLPVCVIIYEKKGVSVGDYFLIQGLFNIAACMFEIPSGYFSDVCSRRKLMISGIIVFILSLIILYFAEGFYEILMSEMIMGVSSALFSGTTEAYVFDSLKKEKMDDEYLKYNGSIRSWTQAGSFIATITGGFMYSFIGVHIILLNILLSIVALICQIKLPELKDIKRKVSKNTNALKDIFNIVKKSIQHPELKWLMLFPSIFGSFTLILMWILQPTMEQAGVAVGLFGLFVGTNQFCRIVFSKYADNIYKYFGLKKIIKLICIIVTLAFLIDFLALHIKFMPMVYLFCLMGAIVPAIQIMSSLIFSSFVHNKVKSEERGTMISISSMYGSFFCTATMFLMKPLLDYLGLSMTLLICSILFCLSIIIPMKKILWIDKKQNI